MAEEPEVQVTDPQPTGDVSPEPSAVAPGEPEPLIEPSADIAPEPDTTTPPKRDRVQERIDELTREKHEALREKEYWREELLRQRMTQTPAQEPVPTAPQIPEPVLGPRPRKEDFTKKDNYGDAVEDPDAYMEALADWKMDTRMAQERHRQEQERAQQDQQKNVQRAQEFIARASERYPDFPVLMRTGPQLSPIMVAAVLSSENNIEVAYYLHKNPQEIIRLSNLDPVAATIAIGKLDAKMSAPAVQPKTITNAPTPIVPVAPTGPSAVTPDQMSTGDYIAWKDEQEFGPRK